MGRGIVEKAYWVQPGRPRRIKDWTSKTKVFVTDWGDRVHLDPRCPGIDAYGGSGDAVLVRLSDPLCFARTGCLKCFGPFFGDDSLRELEHLINRIHGELDEDQPVRGKIAAKARNRFKDTKRRSPDAGAAPAPGGRPHPGEGSALIVSSGYGRPPKRRRPSR